MTSFIFCPYTRGLFSLFSAAWLARMPATRLSFNDFDCVVTKDEVKLFMKRNWG